MKMAQKNTGPSNATKKKKRKSREELNAEGRERKKQKKHRGNPSGSRSNVESAGRSGVGKKSVQTDPRIGSKKPVQLLTDKNLVDVSQVPPVKNKVKKTEPAKLTREEELDKLENDDRLDELLQRVEQGEQLNHEEQKYVDRTLDRIDELMALLGIEYEDEADAEEERDNILHLLKGRE